MQVRELMSKVKEGRRQVQRLSAELKQGQDELKAKDLELDALRERIRILSSTKNDAVAELIAALDLQGASVRSCACVCVTLDLACDDAAAELITALDLKCAVILCVPVCAGRAIWRRMLLSLSSVPVCFC